MSTLLSGKRITFGLATVLLALFTFMFVVPNVRLAKQTFNAPPENPYLTYVRYDELPYQPEQTRGVATTEADRWFADGMINYLRKDYAGAVAKLELAVKQSPDQPLWWLYLGVSHHLNHKSANAIVALQQADKLSSPAMKNPIRWYLAQSYLLEQKANLAIPLLEQITAEKREYAGSADSLLAQIRPIAKKAL